MTSEKKVLILFEGPKDKAQFLHLAKTFAHLLEEGGYKPVVFGTSIYELYEPLIAKKEADSLPAYLQSIGKISAPEGTRPQDLFSLIYLVFDFDPCYHLFDPKKIEALRAYFSDETQNGLLYINYPMVEALLDCKKEGSSLVLTPEFPMEQCTSALYKDHVRKDTAFVSPEKHHPFNYLPPKAFAQVSLLTLKRYYEILEIRPRDIWSFSDGAALLGKEEKALLAKKVFPLSCFPLMALDYNADDALANWDRTLHVKS
jgi:hypothetical protein